jgi:hypothetical protein
MALFTGLAVAAFLGLESTFVAGAIAFGLNAAIGLAASLGLNYAMKALAGTPAAADAQHFSAQGTLAVGGDVPRSFQFGYSVTAGSLVYANEWGDATDTPNAYHTQVIALQDIPGGTLAEIWVNGQLCTLGPVTNALLGAPVTQYAKDGKDHLWIRYHDGTQTTADDLCVTRASSTSRPYESTRVGTGVAYVVATAYVNDTLFTGFPTYKFALSGIPLYDISKDTTAGGSGSHRWSDKSTWGGDGDNLPGVQIYNLLRGITYGSTWLYGLQAMTGPRLPASNWIAQINKCRATVTGESGNEPAYRSGAQITVSAPLASAIEGILTACQGRLAEIGGFYKLHLGAPDSATFSWQDDDILSSEEQHFTPFFGLADSVNGISAKYPFPAEGWVSKVAPPYYRTDLEALDGNRRLLANPSFDFVQYTAQVQRLQKSAIQEAQRARRHAISLPPEFWIVEPGDIGQWTSVRNGYSNKQFRVDGVSDRANLDVVLNITEVDPADYSWNHAVEFTPITTSPSDFVRPAGQAIRAWNAIGITINDTTGSPRRPAIQLQWDGTVPGVVGIEYQVRLTADLSSVTDGSSPPGTFGVGAINISQSILPNTAYQARGRYVPSSPRDMIWSSWLDVTTPDVRLSLDEFDAGLRDLVTAQFNTANSRIAGIEDFIASIVADQDAANRIERMATRTDLSYRETVLAGGTTALAGTVQTLSGTVSTVQSITSSNSSVLATLQNTVSTNYGDLSSRVNTNATSVSGLNSSFASYTVTTTASISGLSASVTTNSTAVATINGKLAASYGVNLDVNGYMSGFKNLNDGSFSSFVIRADVFQVAFPGQVGGGARTAFQIANVNGTAQLTYRGDMFADGTIFARNMTAGSITALNGAIDALAVRSLNIGDNAVTVPTSQYSGGLVGGDNNYHIFNSFIMSVDTTGLAGKPITVSATYNFALVYGTGTTKLYRAKIYINGANQAEWGGQNGEGFGLATEDYTFTANGGVMSIEVDAYLSLANGTSTGSRQLRALVTKR